MKNKQAEIAEKILCPDEDGFSRETGIDELVEHDKSLRLGNGGSWCRDDGALGRKYNIKRIKGSESDKFYKVMKEKGLVKSTNGIVAVQLRGFKKNPKKQSIRGDIKKAIRKKRCCVLDIGSNIEVDHKDGRKDDSLIIEASSQKVEDFQATSKAVNDAKRQHCKTCRSENVRYDATKLGYRVSQYIGDETYGGTCVGCYWYDPFEFNRSVSKSYLKPYTIDGFPVVEIKTVKTKDVSMRIPLFVLVNLRTVEDADTIEALKGLKVKESIEVVNSNNIRMQIKRVE